ncbi:hypothetical protein ALC60_10682 [Trachymyrmex zeteki]|uniref:Uncharacterized protein n=1 Tax=Mycetomoellerius zeteki TaxID=64791 RepID=A0A151WQZ4_9HYME|nr:hypothetical protein ALC60_10682 [Trachymyrmex zeteki]
MRATPRQGRCASHNGRRCRDSRGEERGPTDSRVAAGERTKGSSLARRRKRERRSRRKSLRTEARGRKRTEIEKSRKRPRKGQRVALRHKAARGAAAGGCAVTPTSRPPASNEDPEVIACIFLRDEFSARTATATFANFLVARRGERASNWKLGVALASELDRCRWSV